MTRRQRGWAWLAIFMTGGTVFQGVGFTRTGLGTGCQSFYGNGIATGIDFCYLLDCRNGFFGGAFQPCDPNNPANSLLVDCGGLVTTNPNTQDPTTQQQTTTTQQQTTATTNPLGGLLGGG